MIKFTTIKLSEDRQIFTVGALVEDNEYTQNVYIGKVEIFDKSTFNGEPVYQNSIPKTKEVTLDIPVSDILANISQNILFIKVSITEDSIPSEGCPCGYDKTYEIGVYADICDIANQLSNLTNELKDTCSIPKNFINYFLLFKGFEYALRAQKFEKSIEYYDYLLGINNNSVTTKICNCHG